MEFTTCANCREPISDFVGIGGEDWCLLCSQDSAVDCSHCGTLVDRNEVYEVGRWVLNAPAKRWKVSFIEPGCLIGWSLAERINPIVDILRRIK